MTEVAGARSQPRPIASWWWMTSAMTKVRNFSANVGSSPASSASARSRRDLGLLARRVSRRQPLAGLELADLLGALEPLGEQVDQGGVDVVDAGAQAHQLVGGRRRG